MLAIAMLLLIAWLVAGFLLVDDIFIYGDHPTLYWKFWYALNVSWAQNHQLIDWNPFWYAGFPDLQFYPPGYVIIGWLLNLITLGKLSTAFLYESVLWIAFTLPGLTIYYALSSLRFGRLAAFIGGVLGLTFPTFLDGTNALFIGMIGSRMAFGLNALVLTFSIAFLEGKAAKHAFLAILAMALAILAHPYHEIGIAISLGLFAIARRISLARAGARLLLIFLPAALLDAFWLMPLMAHSSTEMIPVIRSTWDQTWRLLTDNSLLVYAFFAIVTLARARHEQDPLRRSVLWTLFGLLLIIPALITADYLFLIERLRVYLLDGVRLIGEYYLPIILLCAIGIAYGVEWVQARLALPRIAAPAIGFLIGAIFLVPTLQTTAYFQSRANEEPRFLHAAIQDYDLKEFWQTLEASSGRVLFTSFYTNLSRKNTDPLPTTLTALTPLFTRRAMMGGTSTHWSPIAALMWSGKINPPVLWGLSEEQDDRALFGVPLESLSPDSLWEICVRFNITTIVASVNDFQTRTFLDSSSRFHSYYNNGFFYVYQVVENENEWADATNARVQITRLDAHQINLHVYSANLDANAQVKVYTYPLWRAQMSSGEPLSIKRDEFGLMQISLPRGEDYNVELRYELGTAERLGESISIASVIVIGVLAFAFGFRKIRPR
ncbi:MAG: hypothetical protein HY070_10680 [Chloroflexi bacterium]|nr:hypothetical protein [Chloroflexota bacterium]